MSEDNPTPDRPANPELDDGGVGVRSLKELIERVSGKGIPPAEGDADSGVAEILPFPFLAMVGQQEMKLALILALVNPAVGGVLLIGPRGTGKTTAVRSLIDLLPEVPRSLCYYGCMQEDVEAGGIEAVCPDCARKYAEGQPLAVLDRVRMVDLPLNSKIEDVVGGVDERAATHDRFMLRRGLLAQADRNLLYVDEVNLLPDEIVDAILDAASQGLYTVRRGPVSTTYHSRFVLIGSMNPEEGRLRPQILDRFGLRLTVRGLDDPEERLEVYRRVRSYLSNPRATIARFAADTALAREEIQAARDLLPEVGIEDEIASLGLSLIERMGIDSLRAEITLYEAARAHAAADGRDLVNGEDLAAVAPMALRMRRSEFMAEFFDHQNLEEAELTSLIDEVINQEPKNGRKRKRAAKADSRKSQKSGDRQAE